MLNKLSCFTYQPVTAASTRCISPGGILHTAEVSVDVDKVGTGVCVDVDGVDVDGVDVDG